MRGPADCRDPLLRAKRHNKVPRRCFQSDSHISDPSIESTMLVPPIAGLLFLVTRRSRQAAGPRTGLPTTVSI